MLKTDAFQLLYQKSYYKKNKNKILIKAKKYYQENKAKLLLNSKNYYEKNKVEISQKRKKKGRRKSMNKKVSITITSDVIDKMRTMSEKEIVEMIFESHNHAVINANKNQESYLITLDKFNQIERTKF